jgi:hypothetical protein
VSKIRNSHISISLRDERIQWCNIRLPDAEKPLFYAGSRVCRYEHSYQKNKKEKREAFSPFYQIIIYLVSLNT